MAYTTIDDPTQYFNTVLWTGDIVDGDGTGHDQAVTGVGFQPDWIWHKCRSHANQHMIVDSVRGTGGSPTQMLFSRKVFFLLFIVQIYICFRYTHQFNYFSLESFLFLYKDKSVYILVSHLLRQRYTHQLKHHRYFHSSFDCTFVLPSSQNKARSVLILNSRNILSF